MLDDEDGMAKMLRTTKMSMKKWMSIEAERGAAREQVTERNYEKLLKKMEDCMKAEQGECSFDPYELNEPLQRAGPLLYAADVYPELKHSSVEGFDDVSALLRARELIVECKAVQAVRKMALDR